MKKERKKKTLVGKIIGWFFLTLLGLLVILVVVSAIRWNIHAKTGEYDTYTFNKTDTFSLDTFSDTNLYIDENQESLKVLQLADPQMKFGFMTRDRKTMSLLDKALDEENPDIVVCTGDLTLSVFTYDTYKYFADYMEAKHQYWTLTYGNHDSQFDCSKYTISQLLSNYKYCLFSPGPKNVKGESNFLVNVYKGTTATVPTYSLVLLDSNMYPEGGDGIATWVYDWIGEDQIDWYEWCMNGLKDVNSNIKTSLYFHIPTKEFSDMYYANELALGHEISSDIDTSDFRTVTNYSGYIQESDKNPNELIDPGHSVGIFYQGYNTGLFDKVKSLGVTNLIMVGHDHVNTMKGTYDGIQIGYGLCSGYHTYPFFDKPNLITKLAGLTDKILFNGKLWVDEDNNQMEKGYTIITVDLSTSNYGTTTLVDRPASYYNK